METTMYHPDPHYTEAHPGQGWATPGCTHWCGSLHRHLFSCCSYTWMVGAAQSIVNLALST